MKNPTGLQKELKVSIGYLSQNINSINKQTNAEAMAQNHARGPGFNTQNHRRKKRVETLFFITSSPQAFCYGGKRLMETNFFFKRKINLGKLEGANFTSNY